MAAKRFPIIPAHPERICWGCDLYCPADDLRYGIGSDRTQHLVELMGSAWFRESGFEDLWDAGELVTPDAQPQRPK